ncbi:MAG: putative metal-binding motif-containing protein, partial [Bifidobacteriaceae bacterium]|nr:putative metal-binding motif-containing protein [Bifidobacteriaceae bacterium]
MTVPDDGDEDGWNAAADCDDQDSGVNPGAAEVPGDGKDNDCDASTPDSADGLVADFGSVGVSGLVDVAWDRVGGSVVGASSVYSSGYGAG